jgi:hypothetical protein
MKPPSPQRSLPRTRLDLLRYVREILGLSQKELSAVLAVSPKAIQSYEQGWRRIPVRVLSQLFVVLAESRRRTLKDIPCWQLVGCPPATRDHCLSHTAGTGALCWVLTSRTCRIMGSPGCRTTANGAACPVVRRLLAAPPPRSPASRRRGAASLGTKPARPI